ncbi:MAG: hypothetical protein ABFC96_18010 [Thermoguttaceae bacterium]
MQKPVDSLSGWPLNWRDVSSAKELKVAILSTDHRPTNREVDPMPDSIDIRTCRPRPTLLTRLAACVICLEIAALAGTAEARTIKNAELDYTLVVPDSLEEVTPNPGMLATFVRYDPARGIPDMVVSIKRMHGVLGRKHFDPSKAPIRGVSGASVRQQKWKGFDIDVLEGEVSQGGVMMSLRGAQIPLRTEAIQLGVLVPVGKEAEADALLSELLAGLDGPSNWLTDEQRSEQIGEAVGGMVVLAVLLFFGIRSWRKRRRGNGISTP